MVQRDQVPRQRAVRGLVGLVQDEVDKVEARDERGRQADVVDDGEARVVPRADGVGRGLFFVFFCFFCVFGLIWSRERRRRGGEKEG